VWLMRDVGDEYLAHRVAKGEGRAFGRGASLASFAAWLHRIARDRAVDLGRKRRIGPLSAGRTTAALKRLRRAFENSSAEARRG
jgi:DNA-directed RNA polymerase specialized sigma24 family protein